MDKVEVVKRRMEEDKLISEMYELYASCTDSGVEKFFDIDSTKKLRKKVQVLKALNEGGEVDEDDYFDILEKMPKDENGKPIDNWY